MKSMTWLKVKFAVGVAVALLVVVGAGTVAISQSGTNGDTKALEITRQSLNSYAALSSYSDSGKVVANGAGNSTETTFNITMQRPKFYRIDWTQTGGLYVGKGVAWSDGSGDYLVFGSAEQMATAKPEKLRDMETVLAMASGVSSSAASTLPSLFFDKSWGNQLKVAASGRVSLKRERDESINGTDCFVISSSLDPTPLPHNAGTTGKIITRLWIGKEDHFIHQSQTINEGSFNSLEITDLNLKIILARQNKPVTPEEMSALRAQLESSAKAAQGQRFVFTETHENIVVNKFYSASDFAR